MHARGHSAVRERVGQSAARSYPAWLLASSIVLHACGDETTRDESEGPPDAAPDQTSDASVPPPCSGTGITGAAPRCKAFAFCATGEYAIDCTAGDGRCRCITVTGKGRRDVAYDPAFCALPDGGDALETAEALEAVFTAASRACEWSP